MSRVMLLLIVVLWMCRSVAGEEDALFPLLHGTALFIAGLLLIVLFMGLWSRVLARHARFANYPRSLLRFHRAIFIARGLIPAWFGVAVFGLGWPTVVDRLLGDISRWPVDLPGMILGTAPAIGAWMALWWAQFPADRAMREHNALAMLEDDLPVHAPPSFWSYFGANVRLQVLFTIVPISLIMLFRDVAAMTLWYFWRIDLRQAAGQSEANIELLIQLASVGMVVLFASEVLRRVLHTQRLPDSPLRARLEALCVRTGLRYREILLWRTNNAMGNAAVMGLLPQMRYILLSDVLLETMTDRQIEAVFAHEIGHVKHWHMGWYVVLVVTLMLLFFGPGQILTEYLDRFERPIWLSEDIIGAIGALGGIGAFFLVFGYLSRRFERQADVYAARMIEQGAAPAASEPAALASYVGKHGASTFASALYRVAVVNNIPLAARNFTHGSIAQRMEYLESLSTDPTRTRRFDRAMSLLYGIMIACLLISGMWVIMLQAP